MWSLSVHIAHYVTPSSCLFYDHITYWPVIKLALVGSKSTHGETGLALSCCRGESQFINQSCPQSKSSCDEMAKEKVNEFIAVVNNVSFDGSSISRMTPDSSLGHLWCLNLSKLCLSPNFPQH